MPGRKWFCEYFPINTLNTDVKTQLIMPERTRFHAADPGISAI